MYPLHRPFHAPDVTVGSVNPGSVRSLSYCISEIFTLSSDLVKRLDAFGAKCPHGTIGCRHNDFESNQGLRDETGSSPVTSLVSTVCQLRLYGRVARFPEVDRAFKVVFVEDTLNGKNQRYPHVAQG